VNTPIYPYPPERRPSLVAAVSSWKAGAARVPPGLTFYGILRDGGVLKGIDDDLGVTPLVRLSVNLAFSLGGGHPLLGPIPLRPLARDEGAKRAPVAFRMIRDLYWEWYWTKVLDEP